MLSQWAFFGGRVWGVCGQFLVRLLVDSLGLGPGCLATYFHSFCGLIFLVLWPMTPTTAVVSAAADV